MNQKCEPFIKGNKTARDKLNKVVQTANALGNIRGDNLIHVTSNGNGYSFTFDVQKLISLLPLKAVGTGIQRAYCKTLASTGNTIPCYLDEFGTGLEITVHCDLFEETNLSGCRPYLEAGDAIQVAYFDGEWRCIWPFHGAEACGG